MCAPLSYLMIQLITIVFFSVTYHFNVKIIPSALSHYLVLSCHDGAKVFRL